MCHGRFGSHADASSPGFPIRNWVVTKTWTDVDSMQRVPARKIRGGPTMATVSVRYIVHDVDAAIAFYTERLGIGVELNPAPGFAVLSRGASEPTLPCRTCSKAANQLSQE